MQRESVGAENRLKQGGNTSAISHQFLQKHFEVSIQCLRWFIFYGIFGSLWNPVFFLFGILHSSFHHSCCKDKLQLETAKETNWNLIEIEVKQI